MIARALATVTLIAAVCAGCASAETSGPTTTDSFPSGPGTIEEHLTDDETREMAGCQKLAVTGNRVKKWVCGTPNDDREMLSVIATPGK